MSTVEKNPTGYKESCILGRIGKLPDEEGRLLVVHGLIDENVHFAHTEKLINSLISAGKPFQQLVCELFFKIIIWYFRYFLPSAMGYETQKLWNFFMPV